MTKFRFLVEVTGQLDGIPGTLHGESDWHWVVQRPFLETPYYRETYGVTTRIVASTDHRDEFGGWGDMERGWLELTPQQIMAGVSPMQDGVEYQIRTRIMSLGFRDWFTNDSPGVGWDSPLREWGKPDQITHVRQRNVQEPEDVGNHWLIEQLAQWPTRVDPERTISVTHLMDAAVGMLRDQQAVLDYVFSYLGMTDEDWLAQSADKAAALAMARKMYQRLRGDAVAQRVKGDSK